MKFKSDKDKKLQQTDLQSKKNFEIERIQYSLKDFRKIKFCITL